MKSPESIDELIRVLDLKSIKSDPQKKKLISSFFRKKELNEFLVESIHFLGSELKKEKESNNLLLTAIKANIRSHNSEVTNLQSSIEQGQKKQEKQFREIAFQKNLHAALELKLDNKIKEIKASFSQTLHNNQNDSHTSLQKLKKSFDSKLNSKVAAIQSELTATLDGQKDQTEISLKNLREAIENNGKAERENHKQLLSKLKYQHDYSKRSVAKLRITLKETATNILKLESLISDKTQDIKLLNKKLSTFGTELNKAQNNHASSDEKIDDQKQLIDSISSTLSAMTERIADLENKVSETASTIAETSTALTVANEDKLSNIESNYQLNERRIDSLHKALESSVLGFIALENAFKRETENTQNKLEQITDSFQTQEDESKTNFEQTQALFQSLKSLVRGSLIEREKIYAETQENVLLYINQISDILINELNPEPLLSSQEYLAFENNYRGSVDLISKRLDVYKVDIRKVLGIRRNKNLRASDLGCGRGEWLKKLEKWGIKNPTGVDSNKTMVDACKEQGIDAVHADLFDYLKDEKSDSHDFISAFHVVEHLSHAKLNKLSHELKRVLRPGGFFLFETPNPGNVIVGGSTFFLDPTHEKPLRLELAQFFFEQRGFKTIKTYTLNGFEIDFNLGSSKKRKAMEEFFDRWFGIGLDYAILIQNPQK